MNRREGVFVVQSDAHAGSRTTNNVSFDEPTTNEMTQVFQAVSVNQNVEEIREACEPQNRQ